MPEKEDKAKKGRGASKTTSLDITERKRMEERIRTFSQAITGAIDAIAITDMKGIITYANPAMEEMYEYEKGELIGKPVSVLDPNQEMANEIMSAMIETGGWHGEIESIKKNKETFPALLSLSTVSDKKGNPIAMMGAVRDITERKRMEKELKESEERYRNLVQNALDIIFTVSLDGTITSLNPAFETVTGWSRSEWIGKPFASLIHPDDLPLAMKLFQDAIEQKASGTLEARIIAKSGEYLLVEVKSTPLTQKGRVIGFWSIARNLTERKRMEEALRESEEKYSTLVEKGNDGIIIIQDGLVRFANPKLLEITGFSLEETVGKQFIDFISPEYRKLTADRYKKRMAGEEVPQNYELEILTKDGRRILVEVNASKIEYEKKPANMAILRDITERKRMELELREAQEKLIRSERLAAIGQLAGGVGHELRNPLGAIKNAVYYIKGKVAKSELAQKEPRVMEFLNIMDDEINTSNKIINDLLGFSRVGKPSVSPTQINHVIDDALSRTPIPESIKLVKKLGAKLPQVEIDASQIQQVLVNIISNAVQAMPEGGKLIIGTREKEGFLEVEIADTGCGIPQEAIGKIFDSLFTTKAKGIGLGLAVCKAIIDRHEGKIEVKSQVGKGTTFITKLPLNRKATLE